MIVISFGKWSTAAGRWFIRDRVYFHQINFFKRISAWLLKKGIYWDCWTPFCRIERRRNAHIPHNSLAVDERKS